jgi:hypothetical protein
LWRGGVGLAVLLLPGVLVTLLVVDPTWAVTDSTFIDPWYYVGYFEFLPQYVREFPQLYYGSRLTWLIPGFLAYNTLPVIAANYLLHAFYHLAGTTTLYLLLARTLGARAALLSAVLLASYAPFLQATGWDYADGPAIALFLLTRFSIDKARRLAHSRRCLRRIVHIRQPLLAHGCPGAGDVCRLRQSHLQLGFTAAPRGLRGYRSR